MAETEEYTAELQDWELLQRPSLGSDDSGTENYFVIDSDGVAVEVEVRPRDSDREMDADLEEGKGVVEVSGEKSSDLMGRIGVGEVAVTEKVGVVVETEEEEEEEDRCGAAEIVDKIEPKSDDSSQQSEGGEGVERSTTEENSLELGGNPMKKSESENLPISNGIGSKLVLWWKLPLDLIKYSVFNIKPVWSISVAAIAVMGFVMLGRRRWNRWKNKNQTIPVKLSFNGKKASQSVARVGRLNEAFSTMRRVPLIKASLPASGITPWPAMALR